MTTQDSFSQSPGEILGTSETCWFVRPDDTKSHKKNKTGPCRRWGHSSGVVNNKLMIYGGTGYTTNPRHWESVYQLDLENWDWLKLEATNKPPQTRDSHCCVAYEEKLYFFGGSNGTDSLDELMEYDLQTNTWNKPEVRGSIPSPREGHSACLFNDRFIVIFGGWNGEETFSDCYLYDIPEKTWLVVKNKVGCGPSAREGQSCCLLRNSIYLFGGQGNTILKDGMTLDNFCNDLHKLQIEFEDDQVVAIWEKIEVEGEKPSKRSSHASCVYQDRFMFVVGGEGYPPGFDENDPTSEYKRQQPPAKGEKDNNQICYPKSDVWYFDLDATQWFRVAIKNEKDFMPRFAHSCHSFKNNILVFGGLQDYNHSTNDICVLSLEGTNPFTTQLYARGRFNGHNGIHNRKGGKLAGKASSDRKKNSQDILVKLESSSKNDDEGTSENRTETIEDSSPKSISVTKKFSQNKFNAIIPTHHAHLIGNNDIFPEPTKATRPTTVQEGQLVSISFINALSGLMSWPLASFGLFVDNARICEAMTLKINYRVQSPRERRINSPEAAVYIQIDDNGKGWRQEEFMRVIMNYSDVETEECKIEIEGNNSESNQEVSIIENENYYSEEMKKRLNEYAMNLKIAGFRLGKTIVYISKNGNEASLGFISADKRFNPDIHKNHVFFYSWKISTGEFLTNFGVKHKSIIFNALKGVITEEELFTGLENISNRIIIVDLNPVHVVKPNKGMVKNYELFLKREKGIENKYDVGVRTLDSCLNGFNSGGSNSLIELSLSSYLSHFYLDPSKVNLKVSLNDKPIEFVNYKELVKKKALEKKSIIFEEEFFEGAIIKNSSQILKLETKEENNEEIQMVVENEEKHSSTLTNRIQQGVLIYSNNRLIRRLESPKLGNLDFLSFQYRVSQKNQKGAMTFDCEGYLELGNSIKPNIFKTEIENPFYSNYLSALVIPKLTELSELNGKRANKIFEDDVEEITKKVKIQ